MGHLTKSGQFKSDKYKWCPPGFFALKFTDKLAREIIDYYASRLKGKDKELYEDLRIACMNQEQKEMKQRQRIQLKKDKLKAKVIAKLNPAEIEALGL